MFDPGKIREAIHREDSGGWLFSGFRGRDSLSLSVLGLDAKAKNTRPWFYIVFSGGEPLKIVHIIESGSLSLLPGDTRVFGSQQELTDLLGGEVLPRLEGRPLACQYSVDLPIISFLDHGTHLLLERVGIKTVSSAALLQRIQGLVDGEGLRSHQSAAGSLHQIVAAAWDFVRQSFVRGKELWEGDVQDLILGEFAARGLETDHPPIVAAGANSGNPHYSAAGRGDPIGEEKVLQLDLWAREKKSNSIYADISWVGYTGFSIPEDLAQNFATLVEVRDGVVDFIARRLQNEDPPSGAETDLWARQQLDRAGLGDALRHRTGHGIDREVHGSGVNLDSVEFPDSRLLLEGSLFSVEPGIYFADYGLRTEINVYIHPQAYPLVTGAKPQKKILTF